MYIHIDKFQEGGVICVCTNISKYLLQMYFAIFWTLMFLYQKKDINQTLATGIKIISSWPWSCRCHRYLRTGLAPIWPGPSVASFAWPGEARPLNFYGFHLVIR